MSVQDEQAQSAEDLKTTKAGKTSKSGKSRSPSAKKRGDTSKSPKAKGKGKNQKEEAAPIGKALFEFLITLYRLKFVFFCVLKSLN